MKWLILFLVFVGAAPAFAGGQTIVRLDGSGTKPIAAIGRQIDVRLSAAFASAHGIKRDFDGVSLEYAHKGEICLLGRKQGLTADNLNLRKFKKQHSSSVCVPVSEISARVRPELLHDIPGAPPLPFYSSSKAECVWRWTKGGGIGFWSEDCRSEKTHEDFVHDAKRNVFSVRVNGRVWGPSLRMFRVPPSKGPEALLAKLKAAGEITNDKECVFVPPGPYTAPPGWSMLILTLTGDRALNEQSRAHHSEAYSPYCGPLIVNWQRPSDPMSNLFIFNDARKDRIYHVRLGDFRAIFDPFSITVY